MADKFRLPPTDKGGGHIEEPKTTISPATALKRKQRKSIEDEINQPDPVGDFVRRIIGGNKEKKKTGY